MFIVVDNDVNTAALSLKADLDKIDRWASTWAVDFNPKKTCYIIFSRVSNNHPPVHSLVPMVVLLINLEPTVILGLSIKVMLYGHVIKILYMKKL